MATLHSLVQSALQAFGSLLLSAGLEDTVRATVQSHFARFKLWAGSIGAHHTWGTRSLIYRLRDASLIRSHLVSLLEDLNGSLSEAISRSQDPRCLGDVEQDNDYVDNELAELLGETTDDTGDGLEHGIKLARLLEQTGNIIDCLLRLSATIKNPAPFDQFKSRVDIHTREYEPYDIDHVREKFPKLDAIVRTRLGKALTQRRGYFKYREDYHLRLQEGLTSAREVHPGIEGVGAKVASSIPQHLGDSTLFAHNSVDVASSEASTTSFALSTNLDALEPRVPPLPKKHADGPFLCHFCFTIISADTRQDWKKHVFRDLRPYVCTWNDCVSTGQDFQKRKDWISHMTQEHWRKWDCPFGCSTRLGNSQAHDSHLKSIHAEQLDTEWATEILVRSTHVDIEKATGNCPMCCNFEVESIDQYASHVGQHLEQLALFALPKTEEHQKEDDKNKVDEIKHLHKISKPEVPDVDNVNESLADIKPQTSDASGESGSSSQRRLGEGTTPEILTSQTGDHSKLALQHFTQSTTAEVIGTHSERDTGQDIFSKRTEDKKKSAHPRSTKTPPPHERDQGQASNDNLSVSFDRLSISAEGSTERQRPRESLQRSSVGPYAGSSGSSSRRPKYVQEKKWYCAWCNFGPLDWTYDRICVECGRQRDQYCRIEYRTRKSRVT